MNALFLHNPRDNLVPVLRRIGMSPSYTRHPDPGGAGADRRRTDTAGITQWARTAGIFSGGSAGKFPWRREPRGYRCGAAASGDVWRFDG
jgi:hypothetical protein